MSKDIEEIARRIAPYMIANFDLLTESDRLAVLTVAQAAYPVMRLGEMRAALEECQDKLWVLHFGLKDEAERQAALHACNMATEALNNESKPVDLGEMTVPEAEVAEIVAAIARRTGSENPHGN